MNLYEFLDKKANEYAPFNPNRFIKIYEKIKHKFEQPKHTVHIVGTNGKGTTGRFLAHHLFKLGFRVGHFSSPHIQELNERFWFNGIDIENNILEQAHLNILQKVEQDSENLSYFEWMSLLAIELFGGCDFFIVEAGVGGEYDSTNAFTKDLSLVTKIGMDHHEFLGNTLEEIATTKINSINNPAIILDNQEKLILDIFFEKEKHRQKASCNISKYEQKQISKFIQKNNFPSFLEENLCLSLSALKFFKFGINLQLLDDIKIQGRFQKVSDNLILDVGHNELAANEIIKNLDTKVTLLYNTYKEKNYKNVLEILKPIIQKVEIVEVKNDRILDLKKLQKTLDALNIEHSIFKKLNNNKKYLAFGSFSVVEKIMRKCKT